MTAVSPVTSVEAYLSALERSGLVPSAGMAAVRENAAKTTDPKQLARDLIKDGTLTKWQAGQLLHNYHALTLGKYELLDQLEAGELGRVYLVENIETKQRHTLKVLAKKYIGDAELTRRFVTEAQQASKLDHRNICRVEEVTQEGDRFYVVMEYVEGQDLQHTVERNGRLAPSQALEIIRQVAEGLAYAHQRGVIHGNLKPSNLIQDSTGTTKILDIGQNCLTPDQSSDLYSLGSILTFLISGKPSASGAEAATQLAQTPDIPEEVTALCCRLMADEPGERPASVDELLTQLDLAVWQASTPPTRVDSANDLLSQIEEKVGVAKAAAEPKEKRLPVFKKPSDPAAAASERKNRESKAGREDPDEKKLNIDESQPSSVVSVSSEKAPETESVKVAGVPTNRRLLVVAGIGAGGVLALGVVAALVIALWSGGETRVAHNAKPPVNQVATVTTPTDEAIAENVAAQSTDAPAALADSQTELAAAAAPPVADPVATATAAPPSAGPTTPVAAAPPAESKSGGAQPMAVKAEPKPEARPAAKPAPPPAKPKPPPKPAPFQGFAKTVSLPELPQTASEPTTQALEPITLGPCKVDDKAQVTARLKGGGTVIRGGKQAFDLQPVGEEKPREWEFKFTSGESATVIAALSAKNEKLDFQWTEEGVKQAATARLLCNCAVELSASGAQHTFSLRQAVNGPPLPISIDKGGGTARWVFDNVPDIKHVFIEATRFDGLRRRTVDVPEPVSPGEDLTVWTGPRDDQQFLGLKFESATMAKGVRMTASVEIRSEANDRSVAYNKKEMTRFHDQLNQERNLLNRKLQEAGQAKVKDRTQLEAVKSKLKEEVDMRTKRLTQLESLNKYVTDVQGATAIHFRVYYQADDHQVDLFIAGDPPPRTPQRPPPAKKADEAKK